VEEETRATRLAEAEARAALPAGAPAAVPVRSGGAPRAGDLFPEDGKAKAGPARPTMESLFGPDTPAKPEETNLSAAQVFGDHGDAPALEPEPGSGVSDPESENRSQDSGTE
jgi:hypothetical protein